MSDDNDNVTELPKGNVVKQNADQIAKQIENEFNKGSADVFKKELKELLAKDRELQKAININNKAINELKQKYENGLI